MSIGRRFYNMARSELNALLDKASKWADEEDGTSDADGLETFSESELEAELERRRLARDLEDRIRESAARNAAAGGGARPTDNKDWSPRPFKASDQNAIRKAYAVLELKPGSDFENVKKAYRNMMRKYHPDRHSGSPEKEKAAHELSLKVTQAYKTLEKHLRK